jgi:hypothetical protein
LGEAVKYLGEI